ncbi:MAG: OmpA family protein [Saprospiraceae bacterium]|nr:OmpA family protein [Saprospiraceae bacterium]
MQITLMAGEVFTRSFLFIYIILYSQYSITAQDTLPNLVPNSGFELFTNRIPKNWFNLGRDFTEALKYWSSPTGASPDAYGPDIKVPDNWANKGFGKVKPKTGKGMIGLTMYGCLGGKPHCREYAQIQLIEALVPGQRYQVEFWVRHLPRSYEINYLGVYFSNRFYDVQSDALLFFKPQVFSEYILHCDDYWEKVSGSFVSKNEADYIMIGNFMPDSLTHIRTVSEEPLGFAYYYFDDISVRKLHPIIPVPPKENDIQKANFEKGNIITLHYIYFETDKAELLPRSFEELDQLIGIMKENINLKIEIRGHTDSQGNESYNEKLSQERAKEVVEYLIESGIKDRRLTYSGYGSRQPIASNNNEKGRRQNRRVEIHVLEE